MRLGIRDPYGLQIAHGMHTMTHRDEIARPAIPTGSRSTAASATTSPDQRLNQLCYSNEELFRETVRYVRRSSTITSSTSSPSCRPTVTRPSASARCAAARTRPSAATGACCPNYVWDFVNRVAKRSARRIRTR